MGLDNTKFRAYPFPQLSVPQVIKNHNSRLTTSPPSISSHLMEYLTVVVLTFNKFAMT